jgi:hypothetical protein
MGHGSEQVRDTPGSGNRKLPVKVAENAKAISADEMGSAAEPHYSREEVLWNRIPHSTQHGFPRVS